MLDLTNMSVATQSNGKVTFIDLSASKVRAERKKAEIFQMKYVCEIKPNTKAELEKKHNIIIDKSFLADQTKDSFWTIGKNVIGGVSKAFAIQSLDGLYGAGKMIAKVWKGENPSTKITSEAAHSVLLDCGLVDNNTAICTLELIKMTTNLSNCVVYEIVASTEPEIEVEATVTVEETYENEDEVLPQEDQEIVQAVIA
jgi:hypothetical protein